MDEMDAEISHWYITRMLRYDSDITCGYVWNIWIDMKHMDEMEWYNVWICMKHMDNMDVEISR